MKATAIWLPQLPQVAGKLRLISQAESQKQQKQKSTNTLRQTLRVNQKKLKLI
jgi:hypothetical protein